MRCILIFFIPLLVKPSDAFLEKFAVELAKIPAPLTPTFECTTIKFKIGRGIFFLCDIHSRLESSSASWFVYTKWPLSHRSKKSFIMWEAATMLKRHQPWCSIILFFDFSEATLAKRFLKSFFDRIYRTETVFFLIWHKLGDGILKKYLLGAPCLVILEIYRTEEFYYLERHTDGANFRSTPHSFSIMAILGKFPSLDDD